MRYSRSYIKLNKFLFFSRQEIVSFCRKYSFLNDIERFKLRKRKRILYFQPLALAETRIL